MKTRFILIFDVHGNPNYINPEYIVGIQKEGTRTTVHMSKYSFQTNNPSENIYQEILNFDVNNSIKSIDDL